MPISRRDIATMHQTDCNQNREVINFLKEYIDLCLLFSGSDQTIYAINLAQLSTTFRLPLETVLSDRVKSKIVALYGELHWRVVFSGSAPTLVLMPK